MNLIVIGLISFLAVFLILGMFLLGRHVYWKGVKWGRANTLNYQDLIPGLIYKIHFICADRVRGDFLVYLSEFTPHSLTNPCVGFANKLGFIWLRPGKPYEQITQIAEGLKTGDLVTFCRRDAPALGFYLDKFVPTSSF